MSDRPDDLADLLQLAAQLEYGRGGLLGCMIPLEDLRALKAKLSDAELTEFVKQVQLAHEKKTSATRNK